MQKIKKKKYKTWNSQVYVYIKNIFRFKNMCSGKFENGLMVSNLLKQNPIFLST